MQVGINCLQVDPSSVGGVNSYVLGLLEGFARVENGCRFRLFVADGNKHLFEKFRPHVRFDVVVIHDPLLRVRSGISRATLLSRSNGFYRVANDFVFRHIRGLMEEGSDVLYTPTPVLRYFDSRRPTVLTMHDIQHLHHPEFFDWARLLSRRITYGLSAHHAKYFQASSEFIRSDLLTHFPWLSTEQVEVIPPGVRIEQFAAPAVASRVLERFGLPERFLFFPAQLWPHKNHLTLLKALKQIEIQQGLKIPLVLTGDRFAAAPKIFGFVAEQSMNYVHYLGKVALQDMVALYQNAAFMITPTLHEASSFPILESAAAGTPVIASKLPPFEELGQVLKLNLFNPLDVEELARLIMALWSDVKTGKEQAAYNRQHVAVFSWENAARKYVQLFDRSMNS
jgi:glycosyltransferase involved in cell wall biosynthesis